MTASPRAGRFERQVRLVLVLIVFFLAVLDLLNVVLLVRARNETERAERERAKARGREVARLLDPEVLAAPVDDPRRAVLTAGLLSRTGLRFDLPRIAIWDASGVEVVASGAGASGPVRLTDLDADEKAALGAGRAVASDMTPRAGGDDAVIAAFVPVLDAAGRLASVLEVQQAVPELGSMQRRIRLLVAAQAAGVVLIGIVALVFGRFVSRPYRALAAVAGDAGLAGRGADSFPDPDDLAAAFRGVAEKLRSQEAALQAMEGAGGLADLVRFAAGAARGMATGVLVVERSGRLAASNPAGEALLRFAPGAARGREIASFGPELAPLRELVRACLEGGHSVSREVIELRFGGAPIEHLGVTISPVAGPRGDVSGVLVLMTDLTEIRQIQQQVSLKEHLAAVGALSAGIAHEFRNALGTILGYAKMLEKRDDPRIHGPAREILKEVDAVRAQIDEFLLYARPPQSQRAPVDLEPLVRAGAQTASGPIDVDVSGEFGIVAGDPALLKRVIDNLLRNAADAGAECGRRVRVSIRGRRTASAVQIEVEDDGPGIPPDRREQVFLPFFTTRARGTGLGLALVQRTLVDLGGAVDVGEGPRGGASFRLRIPLGEGFGEGVTNRDSSSR